VERNDVRWIVPVSLLQNAPTFVQDLNAAQSIQVAELLDRLQTVPALIRWRRSQRLPGIGIVADTPGNQRDTRLSQRLFPKGGPGNV
jgi:hypothetical protein